MLRSYEQAKGEYIPRHEMFQEYTDFCDREGLEKRMAQNIFGKYVRHAFPGIQTKRVGGRGQQIRCYAHLRRAAGGGQQPPPQHPPTPQPQRTTTGKKRKSVVKRKTKKNPTKKRKQDSASDPSDEHEDEESEEKNQGYREQRTRKEESAETQTKMTRRSTRNLVREKEKLQANPKRADHFHQEEEAGVEDIREHVPSGKKVAEGPTEQESERILKKRKREDPLLKQFSPEKAGRGLDCILPALDAAPSSKGMQLVPVGGRRAIEKRRKVIKGRGTRKKKIDDDEEYEEKEDANEGEVETKDKLVAYRVMQDESDDESIPLFDYLYREYSKEQQKRQPFPGKYSFSLSLSLHNTQLIDQ